MILITISTVKKEIKTMKRTKTMIYQASTESNELFLFITNDADLYRQTIQPAINNLKKKYKKGIYDINKAVDLWYYVATNGSNLYNKYYGYNFTVTERFTCAIDLEKYFKEDIENF